MGKISKKEQFYRGVIGVFFSVLQRDYRELMKEEIHFKVENNYRYKDFVEVQFHIDIIPDWLFGVWFSKINKYTIEYRFFGQYEDTIDKFRPSHSAISCKNEFGYDDELNTENNLYVGEVCRLINFIKEEPVLAFARDYCGWNYNTEYHTRAEAQKVLNQYLKWKSNKAEWEPKCRQIVLDYVIGNIMPYLPEFCIIDETENTSPRYNIMATYKVFENGTEENCGCYGLESFIEEAGGNAKEIMKGLYKAEKEAVKLAKKHHIHFSSFSCFNYSVDIIKNVNKYIKDLGYTKVFEEKVKV